LQRGEAGQKIFSFLNMNGNGKDEMQRYITYPVSSHFKGKAEKFDIINIWSCLTKKDKREQNPQEIKEVKH